MTKKTDTLANLTAGVIASPTEAQKALATSSRKDVPLKKPKPTMKLTGFWLRLDTVTYLKQASVDDAITAANRVQALLDVMSETPGPAALVADRARRDGA